jgi:GH24 family phage-related lysozyme (muramidase)
MPPVRKSVDMKSSQASILMIIDFEVTSQSAYTAKYQAPTWPGGQSGVTIGIGYDCGYSTAAEIRADWGPQLPAAMVAALARVAGLRGSPAASASHSLRDVVKVPWAAAMAVFEGRDIPKWENIITATLPNTSILSPDSFGSLVSLAYNRGASFSAQGDRYREMRAIKANMAAKNPAPIPNDIRSMARLWPTVPGLQIRRRQEADLFQKGLTAIAAPQTGV